MSIIRSTIFQIGDMVDSMHRGEDLHDHVHRLNELRGQLKWLVQDSFPLQPQNLDGREETVNSLLQLLPFTTTEHSRKLLNRFIYGCIADALNRGPSQAGTESPAVEKESASTTQESVRLPSDQEFLDKVMLTALPVILATAVAAAKAVSVEAWRQMLNDVPEMAYAVAHRALEVRKL